MKNTLSVFEVIGNAVKSRLQNNRLQNQPELLPPTINRNAERLCMHSHAGAMGTIKIIES